MQPFTLSGEHLRLRPLEPADEDDVLRACQDPEVSRWTAALPEPYTRQDAEAFVSVMAPDDWARDRAYTWAITDATPATGDELLGVIGLAEPAGGRPEIGYWLTPHARGRGLMVRAVQAVCRCAFDRLAADVVLWKALVGNEASRRVAERVGFQVGEPVRRYLHQRGVWRDAWVATLLPDDPPVPEQATLTDGVVTLRRWEGTDLPMLAEQVDEAVLEWTTFPGRSAAQLREWIVLNRRVRRAPAARFAIADGSGMAVGGLRLSYDPISRAVGLGWWLGPAARGSGYARRALQLAIPWAANAGALRFVAEIYAGNAASVVLAERVGMQAEGRRRAHWPAREPAGPRRDTWLYGLVPEDTGWPAGTDASGPTVGGEPPGGAPAPDN